MKLPTPGERFDERYEIRGELGEGGFAIVYDAVELAGGRRVALKVLKPSREGEYDRELRARFEREAQLVAQLKSPHSVSLYASGQSSSGLLYLAFEHLPGEDLAELLHRQRRLEPDVVVRLLTQLLGALREAHTTGLVHRDIKPANIRIIPDGEDRGLRAVLLDFGIARATKDGHPRITKTGELIGTPRYMSPEQLTAKPLGPASDIYSLGMVAFEALVGTEALQGGAWGDQLERLRSGHVFSAPEVVRIGRPLLAVVQKMTARECEERYQTAAAVLRALDGVRGVERAAADVEERPPWGIAVVVVVLLTLMLSLGYLEFSQSPVEHAQGISRVRENPLNVVTETPTDAEPSSAADLVHADVITESGLPDDAPAPTGCGLDPPEIGAGLVFRQGLVIYVPESYDKNTPTPVVLLLHTAYQKSEDWLAAAGFTELVNREGFILLLPYDRGHELDTAGAWTGGDRDVERVRGEYEFVRRQFCVDETRVFVLGHGDGARVALPLSCEPWVTAVSVSSFGLPTDELDEIWCPAPPRPLIWFHPTESAQVRSEPGRSCRHVEMWGPDKARELAMKRNGCDGPPKDSVREKHGFCQTWRCERTFEYCEVEGGAPWTGQDDATIERVLCGKESATRFGMTEHVWRFFSAVAPTRDTEPGTDP